MKSHNTMGKFRVKNIFIYFLIEALLCYLNEN